MQRVGLGIVQGFAFVLGERAACLLLNYVRDRHLARQPFGGKVPYRYLP